MELIDKASFNLIHKPSTIMNIGRRILIPASLVAALWFSAGCDGMSPFFDSTNLNPHRPVIRNLRVATAPLFLNVTGAEISFTYEDAGADIEEVHFIILGLGATQAENPIEPTPADPRIFDELFEDATNIDEGDVAFFPGETGELRLIRFLFFPSTALTGRHVIKMYLTDSKDSRSEPQYFIVELVDRF